MTGPIIIDLTHLDDDDEVDVAPPAKKHCRAINAAAVTVPEKECAMCFRTSTRRGGFAAKDACGCIAQYHICCITDWNRWNNRHKDKAPTCPTCFTPMHDAAPDAVPSTAYSAAKDALIVLDNKRVTQTAAENNTEFRRIEREFWTAHTLQNMTDLEFIEITAQVIALEVYTLYHAMMKELRS